MVRVGGALTDEALAQLQRSLLEAILLDRPLPGAGRAPAFGDRALLLSRPTIVLLDENLAPGLSLDEAPLPLRRLSRDELLDEARREGELLYLRFSEPEQAGAAVLLALEARIASGGPEGRDVRLSSVQAAFRETDGRWEVEGDVASSAS